MENKEKSYFAPFLSNAGTLKNTFATLITFSWFIVLFGEVMMFLYARIGSKVRQTAD